MAQKLEITALESFGSPEAVRNYIFIHPESQYSDRLEWNDALSRSFDLEVVALVAHEHGQVVGCCQFVINRTFMRGPHGISAPLTSSGGGLIYDRPEVGRALLAAAKEHAMRAKLKYLLMRLKEPMDCDGWTSDASNVTFLFALPSDYEEIWKTQYRDKTRNQIRKAEKNQFKTKFLSSPEKDFFKTLCAGLKEVGAPHPPLQLFQIASENFGDDVAFALMEYEGKPIAAGVLFTHGQVVYNPWTVTLQAYHPLCANIYFYDQIIRWAVNRGCKQFNLGRSPVDSSQFLFKKRLGAEPKPLHYLRWSRTQQAAQLIDSRMDLFQRIWRHVPAPVASRLGPLLVKEYI